MEFKELLNIVQKRRTKGKYYKSIIQRIISHTYIYCKSSPRHLVNLLLCEKCILWSNLGCKMFFFARVGRKIVKYCAKPTHTQQPPSLITSSSALSHYQKISYYYVNFQTKEDKKLQVNSYFMPSSSVLTLERNFHQLT